MTQNSLCLIDEEEESGPPLRSNMAPAQWICNPAAAAPSAVTCLSCHVSWVAGSQWWQKPALMVAQPPSKAQINTWNQAANSHNNSRVSERKHFVKLTVCCLIAVLSHLHSLSQQLSWCRNRVGWAALGSLFFFCFFAVVLGRKHKKRNNSLFIHTVDKSRAHLRLNQTWQIAVQTKEKSSSLKTSERQRVQWLFWSIYSRATEKLFKGVSSWSTSCGLSL